MFGFFKQKSVDASDSDDTKQVPNPARRTSSDSAVIDAETKEKYKNGFKESGGLENQSVQELENYAVYNAEETTDSVNNCLRIAEDIRGDATKTLDTLHQQGEQITRTHDMVADTEKDLNKGEKLLNNLGGMFSKTWKPKKGKKIEGPKIVADKPKTSNYKKEQREKLGLGKKTETKTPPPEPTNAMEKVQLEKTKQDDALSDLSNILGDLKGMASEMGTELDRQNHALDHLSDDVDELNSRMKGANTRARKLVNK